MEPQQPPGPESQMGPDPFEIPADVRCAVGDVMIWFTRVEVQLAQIARHYRGETWEWASRQLAKPAGARRAVQEVISDDPPVLERERLQELYDRAEELARERNRLAHDPFVKVFGDGAEPVKHQQMSVRTQELRPVQAAELEALSRMMEEFGDELSRFRPLVARDRRHS